jgi:uroporphyrin-III C-methyltransferase/precorrin-2 dehydrogenase/sirohydrochlorin ferrochelatase
MSALLPLFVRLAGRPVLVVGAGSVAARKIAALLEVGAVVRVVAPAVSDEVVALGDRIELHHRPFAADDLEGVWLVIAATSSSEVNAAVARAAEPRRLLVNAVDDPPNASAFFGAILRRPPLTVAISSDGELPGLVRLYRELLERLLPAERHIAAARALRARWRREHTPMGERFAELVRSYFKQA